MLLIEKQRPAWQRGLVNGIGGKVESGETPAEAMAREFLEECGIATQPCVWKHRVTLQHERWCVYFFAAELAVLTASQETDEKLVFARMRNLPRTCIPNLRWLVPLCFDLDIEGPVTLRDVS